MKNVTMKNYSCSLTSLLGLLRCQIRAVRNFWSVRKASADFPLKIKHLITQADDKNSKALPGTFKGENFAVFAAFERVFKVFFHPPATPKNRPYRKFLPQTSTKQAHFDAVQK